MVSDTIYFSTATPPAPNGDDNDPNDRGPKKFKSRKDALQNAKRDAGVPRSTHPDKVERVPLRDRNGKTVISKDGQPVLTREYHYTRPDGSKVIIQEHSAGHPYGGVGDVGPHFNVRPPNNPKGKVPGTRPHYEW